jgi:hypothetical protein
MIPRDPKRIDRVVELLREAWHLFPDQRPTQLVINAADTHHDCGPVFYLEDDKMEQRLQKSIAARRKYLEQRRRVSEDNRPDPDDQNYSG